MHDLIALRKLIVRLIMCLLRHQQAKVTTASLLTTVQKDENGGWDQVVAPTETYASIDVDGGQSRLLLAPARGRLGPFLFIVVCIVTPLRECLLPVQREHRGRSAGRTRGNHR